MTLTEAAEAYKTAFLAATNASKHADELRASANRADQLALDAWHACRQAERILVLTAAPPLPSGEYRS